LREDNESIENTKKKQNAFQKFYVKKGPIKLNTKNPHGGTMKSINRDIQLMTDKFKLNNVGNQYIGLLNK
jgi:hypothetical protein